MSTENPTPAEPAADTNDLAKRRRVHQLTHELGDLATEAATRVCELVEIGVDTRDIVRLSVDGFPDRVKLLFEGTNTDGMAFTIDSLYLSAKHPDRDASPEVRAAAMREYSVMMGKYQHGMEGSAAGPIYDQLHAQVDRIARDPNLRRTPMEKLVERLFTEAPKLTDGAGAPIEGQAPALECSIVLRTLPMQLTGSLSRTPEGTLRLLSPAEIVDPATKRQKRVLAEQFFDIGDVVTIVLQRDVSMSAGERRIITS